MFTKQGSVMSDLSHPAMDCENTDAQHDIRHTFVAAAFIAVLAGLALTMGGGARWFAAKDCKLYPLPALLHSERAATATSRGGAPCLILAHKSNLRIESLEVVMPPRNGTIATRGKTGLVYFPNSQFKGSDSFQLKLVRRTDARASVATTIDLLVNID